MSETTRKQYQEAIGRDNSRGRLDSFTVNDHGNTVTTFVNKAKEVVAYNVNYRDFFIRD